MPYIVLAVELDVDEAKLAAKNCGCTYAGHVTLQSYRDGHATFDGNSENNDLLESLCFVAKIKCKERGAVTAIELDGEIKSTLQLKMKFADKFLGEVSEDCLTSQLEQNSIRHMSKDLSEVAQLSEISIPAYLSEKVDMIAFNAKDVALQKYVYSIAETLMNWDAFAENAVGILEEKALGIDLFKS
jgi:hypothetical protein